MLMRPSSGLMTFIVLLAALGIFTFLLWNNAQSAAPLVAVIPTQAEPTGDSNSLMQLFSDDFGDDSTPFPTIEIPAQPYVPPTLPATSPSSGPVAPATLTGGELYALAPSPAAMTPTPFSPGLTNLPGSTLPPVTVQAVIPTLATFQPPLLAVPQRRILSDHYLFARPVDSNANNRGLSYYPYGSNGAQHSNPQRSHTGIDITNPLNETIRAAGAGRVIFASSPERPYLEGSPAYGNAVLIEHDFSWEGQPLYTLYAHMARVLVLEDAWVNAGDPIGLNGDTGQATGPHVHFEVRLGGGRFGDTVNPYLWMVPYIGHGTIAGRVVDSRGNFIDDADVTLRSYANAITVASTTTYTFFDTVNDVNPDPLYDENFVFGDVPAGRYEVIATIDGLRIIEVITVSEGTTSLVELRPGEGSSFVADSQPVEEAPTPEATQPIGGP